MAAKYKFGLQPALEQAESHRQDCERAFIEARRQVQTEEEKLKQLGRKLAQTRQQIAAEYDKSMSDAQGGVSAGFVAGRRQYIVKLRTLEARQVEAQHEQQQRVDWAHQKMELRREEFHEAANALEALEKYKEKGKREFLLERRKAEDREADDIAATRWKRGSR